MPRSNGEGEVSLLRDKFVLHCVVHNHTWDDNLWKEGWNPHITALATPRGYKRRCRD